MGMFFVMRYREVKGHWPLRAKKADAADTGSFSDHSGSEPRAAEGKAVVEQKTAAT